MKKLALLLAPLALMAMLAAPVAADNPGDTVTIMIMKHTCTEADIASAGDFEAVESAGAGADNPVAALVNTVLACPTTGLEGDEPTEGSISNPRTDFDFTVTGDDGTTMTLADAEYVPSKLCETDIDFDANGDGNKSADVCLDTSHYELTVASGDVTVDETKAPTGFSYGTVRFTPSALNGNNDADSLQSDRDHEPIQLDTSVDEDGMIMLHIYNFEMHAPDTSTAGESVTGSGTAPAAALIALALFALLGATKLLASRSEG